MRTFRIGKNDSGQRLDKFLSKAVKQLPQSLMYKYIRQKRIKVNGKKQEISYRLAENDEVTLYIRDEFFEEQTKQEEFLLVSPHICVLYEDDQIMLIDKPAGLVVHADDEGTVDTLINRSLRYLYEKGEYDPRREHSFTPSLCNRIDRNTGGIVALAKTADALREMNECFRARRTEKYYLCLVHGHLKEREGKLLHYHRKDEKEKKALVFDHMVPGSKTMITGYRVLSEIPGYSLLEVRLYTGRTHQIRAQFAHIGHPLLGDGKYADNREDRKKGFSHQALYAYKIMFHFPEGSSLSYLDGQIFQIEKVPFASRDTLEMLSS